MNTSRHGYIKLNPVCKKNTVVSPGKKCKSFQTCVTFSTLIWQPSCVLVLHEEKKKKPQVQEDYWGFPVVLLHFPFRKRILWCLKKNFKIIFNSLNHRPGHLVNVGATQNAYLFFPLINSVCSCTKQPVCFKEKGVLTSKYCHFLWGHYSVRQSEIQDKYKKSLFINTKNMEIAIFLWVTSL